MCLLQNGVINAACTSSMVVDGVYELSGIEQGWYASIHQDLPLVIEGHTPLRQPVVLGNVSRRSPIQ
ncbi:hypothetical protein [Pseudomonas sp. Pseusp16]|uniref:hypothetical protein n=1 Tax=Pseudomonas sp. Pseusp16 TaxID=3243021 RepID=UPI0039B4507D